MVNVRSHTFVTHQYHFLTFYVVCSITYVGLCVCSLLYFFVLSSDTTLADQYIIKDIFLTLMILFQVLSKVFYVFNYYNKFILTDVLGHMGLTEKLRLVLVILCPSFLVALLVWPNHLLLLL